VLKEQFPHVGRTKNIAARIMAQHASIDPNKIST